MKNVKQSFRCIENKPLIFSKMENTSVEIERTFFKHQLANWIVIENMGLFQFITLLPALFRYMYLFIFSLWICNENWIWNRQKVHFNSCKLFIGVHVLAGDNEKCQKPMFFTISNTLEKKKNETIQNYAHWKWLIWLKFFEYLLKMCTNRCI